MDILPKSQISYNLQIEKYKEEIDQDPYNRKLYWDLSLCYLLNGQDDDAQMIWMSVLSEAESPEELDVWNQELLHCVVREAEKLEVQGLLDSAFSFYFYAHQILPTSLPVLLKLISATIRKGEIENLQNYLELAIELSRDTTLLIEDTNLVIEVISQILEEITVFPMAGKLVASLTAHIRDQRVLMKILLPNAVRIAYSLRSFSTAVEISEAYLLQDPDNYEFLGHLASFYQNAGDYEKGISSAKRHFLLAPGLVEKIFSSHLVLRGLLNAGGYWDDAVTASEDHIKLLSSLTSENTNALNDVQTLRLFTSSYYLPYFKDSPLNRRLINHVSQLCQRSVNQYIGMTLESQKPHQFITPVKSSTSRKLKVGYLSHCMSQHSVGWLARWLIKHHDRDQFELYGYFIDDRPYDNLHQWYVQQFDHTRCWATEYDRNSCLFAEKISDDSIDILIDLDSITLDVSCEILAMKPAPIQATWLGWDAIGMDAIDYFIADPYVLPDHAQDYYTEKIWRLPETYLAVDGFEVSVPTLKRSDLKLPENAVTFLTAQRGYKRHRDTAILQMKIIAGVPDAYLLIKGFADDQSIQNFFYEIADEVGVTHDRLRFLESDPSEAIHRANLRIADVVLDTYPYNGATTTMETLWMEVPIVTRVGEQFAARNSYTMMMNAGIIEGIAWSAEEYIEWGIKFGTDAKLRQAVSWKLRESKKTSPLWDGKKFARQMEDAYQEMWKIYAESNS